MGLFSRFKSSPSASTSSPTASASTSISKRNRELNHNHNESINQSTSSKGSARPTTPTSSTHLTTHTPQIESPSGSTSASTSKLVRPSIPPPSPSNNSIASRLRWKKGKGKEKDQGQGAGRSPLHTSSELPAVDTQAPDQDQDPIGGIPYESSRPLHIPTQPRTTSLPNTPQSTSRRLPEGKGKQRRRSTLLSFDDPSSTSPLSNTRPLAADSFAPPQPPEQIHPDAQGEEEHILDQDDDLNGSPSSANRKNRIASGQFRQVGGILGQWDFEVDSGSKGSSPPEKWLKRQSNPPPIPIPAIQEPATSQKTEPPKMNDSANEGLTPSVTNESIVFVNKEDLLSEVEGDVSQISTTHGSSNGHDDDGNRVEILESAEKKTKFWKRPRRSSKSHTDEVERSHSPTPRRDSRNATSLDLTNDRPSVDINQPIPRQPRPPQLRRPSSSFFHNPFNRSASRTSLAIDYENSKPADDGSFQLKGFRHVSGMMEVEGAGELENYLAHVRKDPRSSISSADLLTSPVIGNHEFPSPSSQTQKDMPSPPSSYALAHPPPVPLSRPASVAHSLGSATGEEFMTANKVSVAAFRKGIRRPSENLVTMSDIGHGAMTPRYASGQHSPLHHATDDEDDDDVPLGMIKGKDLRREKSSQSLSNMRDSNNVSPAIQSTPANNSRRPSTMFYQIERQPSPAITADQKASAHSAIKLTPEQNTSQSPSLASKQPTQDVKFKPGPNATPNISRRASPALTPGQEIARKSSPNPTLTFTVHRQKQGHQRNGGGSAGSGFVVKSGKSSRGDLKPQEASGGNTGSALNSPSVSGASTPNPPPGAKSPGQANDASFVTSPEEIEPIDGYFSHLAPFINDEPARPVHSTHSTPSSVSVSRGTPNIPLDRQGDNASPARAPGPPVAPLPLPEPGDASPGQLNLPLPPDKMPDTPPKQPTDLPATAAAPDSLSPNARKKLSLLQEPMKIISGLWHPPSTIEETFDPAFVLSSMDALGGNSENSTPANSQQRTITNTHAETDLDERVRSPLAERLAGIAYMSASNNNEKYPVQAIQPTSDHLPDNHIERLQEDHTIPQRPKANQEFSSSFARAKARKVPKDDSTESEDETESESTSAAESSGMTPRSKAQAKPIVGVSSNAGARKSKMNSPITATGERQVPLGPRKPSTGSNRKRVSSMYSSLGSSMTMSNINDTLKQPHEDDDRPLGRLGKSPSVSDLATSASLNTPARRDMPNAPRPKTLIELGPVVQPLKDLSTDHSTSPTSMTSFRPQLRSRGQSRNHAQAQAQASTSSSQDSQRQPMTSRQSPPTSQHPPSSRHPPPQPPSSSSQQQQRPRAPVPTRTTSEEKPKNPNSNSRSSPSPNPTAHRAIKRSPAQTLIKLPENEIGHRKTASPDSSRSGTTGGTGGSVNYQPMTPKDPDVRKLQEIQSQLPLPLVNVKKGPTNTDRNNEYDGKQISREPGPIQGQDRRQRSHSSMGQNQNKWNTSINMGMGMGMGYNSNPTQNQNHMMGMGMMPPMGMGGMDPEAMRNMMKQQWQMQFMAAAYRASEEEWERQSCVSGQTNHTLPASFGQASQMPNMGWGIGVMGQYPNPMAVYGNPQAQAMFPSQPYGYPIPPPSPSAGSTLGLGLNPQGGGGMYSYGTNMGAQSVFGGEFGPPPITPSQRFMGNQAQLQPPLPANTSNQPTSNRGRNRRDSSSLSQSVYIPSNLSTSQNSPPPPSSWGRRSAYGSGDWSDINNSNRSNTERQNLQPPGQSGQNRRARPSSQFAN
ncbi:uncharacterized protein I303_105872 [Kwoniella dejecticola CBS 10117]|uniref:Uncharacterized protein n=1 Tax=Kwoniella dejecticola CBS 10117 TaxID=1296121 RepID=A0A1A6A0P0_9TREE|nr:uncharacterized protein I303_05893 [Kwoniella dejecticola CBS 10117]OBR83613.1 hypothetical protein I303_05893 [Kwoniella dejecticola CBS 10117]